MANGTEEVKLTPTIDDLPESSVEGQPVGQPLDQASSSAVTLESVLASPKLQEYIEKQVQSKTDSRLGTYGTRLDTVEGTIAQYNSLVGATTDPKAVATLNRDVEFQNMKTVIEELQGGNVVSPSAGAGEKSWGEKQQAILDSAGVDASDVRVVELLRSASSKQEFLAELEAKSFGWKQSDANKPKPSASTVLQTIPAVPAGDGTYTNDKYVEDMLAASGDKSKLQAVKAKARADGVDVDNIGFT